MEALYRAIDCGDYGTALAISKQKHDRRDIYYWLSLMRLAELTGKAKRGQEAWFAAADPHSRSVLRRIQHALLRPPTAPFFSLRRG